MQKGWFKFAEYTCSTGNYYYLKYVLFKRTLKGMRYTFKQFKEEYPDDAACLRAVLENRYGFTCPKCGSLDTKFYPITGRKGFACRECRGHVYPLAGTIFHKSETPLWSWFYAIYLFSVSKNGVSAKELERHLGVTYKTAWRMAKQIRLLMEQETGGNMFGGDVEADETYIGGKRNPKDRYKNKVGVYGLIERDGWAMAFAAEKPTQQLIEPMIRGNVVRGSRLMTDESYLYRHLSKEYLHVKLRHMDKEYVRGTAHTNTIEGFWGQLKRSLDGTYHMVSPKYLQHYVDEFVFRYNHRHVPICPVLLELAATRV